MARREHQLLTRRRDPGPTVGEDDEPSPRRRRRIRRRHHRHITSPPVRHRPAPHEHRTTARQHRPHCADHSAQHHSFDEFFTALKRWETLADVESKKADDEANHDSRHGHVTETDTGINMAFGGGDPIVAAEAKAIFDRYCEEQFAVDADARDQSDEPVVRPHCRAPRQRLFSPAAKRAAALLPTSCSWSGCFVPAELCDTDHIAEWGAEHGPTDLVNATPTCSKHNWWRSQHRYRATPSRHGTIVQHRPDNSIMHPVGQPRPHPAAERFPIPVVTLDYQDVIDRPRRNQRRTR